jgi:hypothetical protein
MFSRMERENRNGSCSTMPMWLAQVAARVAVELDPSSRMLPLV